MTPQAVEDYLYWECNRRGRRLQVDVEALRRIADRARMDFAECCGRHGVSWDAPESPADPQELKDARADAAYLQGMVESALREYRWNWKAAADPKALGLSRAPLADMGMGLIKGRRRKTPPTDNGPTAA